MRLLPSLAVAALLLAGCSKPAPPVNVLADLDDPARWQPMSLENFDRECPGYAKAVASGALALPDPHTGLVSNVGMETFKVRIENGKIKAAWRERRSD